MNITKVDVHKVEKEGSRMKGVASVLIDDCLAIHDIRIIEGDEGLFIAMPSRKTNDDKYKDIVHPVKCLKIKSLKHITRLNKPFLFYINTFYCIYHSNCDIISWLNFEV